jgi:hypothetical protein
VDVTSTGDVPFNCTYFREYWDQGVIYKYYSCNGTVSASLSAPGGLSTGAKAGIGAGAGLGGSILVACIATAIVYCRRRRSRRATQTKAPADTSIVEKLPAEVEAKEIKGEKSPPELQGREADVVDTRPEMEGEQALVAEVDGAHSSINSPLSAELDSRTHPVEMPP